MATRRKRRTSERNSDNKSKKEEKEKEEEEEAEGGSNKSIDMEIEPVAVTTANDTADTEPVKILKLQTTDSETVEVREDVMKLSGTIKKMLEDEITVGDIIPIPNVSSTVLKKIIEYCTQRLNHPKVSVSDDTNDKKSEAKVTSTAPRREEPTDWEKQFCKVDQGTLFEMMIGANFLEIEPLVDLIAQTIANMIKGKKPSEIRTLFNIKNDFTPEEEEQIRKENEWCEET
jgi:S-phase kinase-associated protein 1